MLIANRGEIAIRIARTAASMGIACVTVGSQDDVGALHIHRGAEARILSGVGPAAYLDIAQLIAVARDTGCDAVHPGYGFLSESAAFARACAEACLRFVGPTPQQLEQLGNKASARSLAVECGVPVLAGTAAATELAEAEAFMAAIGRPVMVKALAGGGRPRHQARQRASGSRKCVRALSFGGGAGVRGRAPVCRAGVKRRTAYRGPDRRGRQWPHH